MTARSIHTPPTLTRPTSAPGPRRRRQTPGGYSSILALLYLLLFSALCLGFFAQTNLAAQVSWNEARVQEAQTATESGLRFMRYHLSAVNVAEGATPAKTLEELYAQLATRLDGTANLGVNHVGYSPATASARATIRVPDAGNVRLGGGEFLFRAVITEASPKLDVKVIATSSDGLMTRAALMQFVRAPRPYALVGVNGVTLSGNAFTDSYDSSKGAYDPTKAKARGSIASNGGITLKDWARVNGDARYGAASALTVAPGAAITGRRLFTTSNLSFPSVTLPPAGTYTDLGDVNNSGGTQTVPGGTYVINTLTLSGTAKIVWSGPVKLYIKNGYNVSGDVVITAYNNLPANRQLFFLPTCPNASWSGTNVCVGDLYAPDTHFTISGSVEKMGRIVAKSINNGSSRGMHYDEFLPAPYGLASYVPAPDTYLEVRP